MYVRLVYQKNRSFRFVGQRELDAFAAGDRARRIIWITNVEHTGIRVGTNHCLDIMCIILCQRNLEHPCFAITTLPASELRTPDLP